jgi:hypothetical protein
MKKAFVSILCLMFLMAAAGIVITADMSKVYCVCNCQDDCKCDFVSGKVGKCKCGSALVAMHVLAIEKSSGVFCRMGAGCTCERSKTDPGKCTCGMSVKKVGLKGKYVCNCGPNCQCGMIADKPGKCTCGKELVKVS